MNADQNHALVQAFMKQTHFSGGHGKTYLRSKHSLLVPVSHPS